MWRAVERDHRRGCHAHAPRPPRPFWRHPGCVGRVDRHAPREDGLLSERHSPARRSAAAAYLHWCGAPADHAVQMIREHRPLARADRLVTHGDMVDAPGLRLRAVWTPGHSPAHLCFHHETHGLLLAGDRVLPRITPNVSAYDLESAPLGDYLDSLETLHQLHPAEVLPAHEFRFAGLGSRLNALRDHHAGRLREAADIVSSRPERHTAWQIVRQVRPRRHLRMERHCH